MNGGSDFATGYWVQSGLDTAINRPYVTAMTAPYILRYLWRWLLWPIRRTPTERDRDAAIDARIQIEKALRSMTQRAANLESRLERRAMEVHGLRNSLRESQATAASSRREVEIMQAALENIRGQYKKDVAIAARREAFGMDKPPTIGRVHRS